MKAGVWIVERWQIVYSTKKKSKDVAATVEKAKVNILKMVCHRLNKNIQVSFVAALRFFRYLVSHFFSFFPSRWYTAFYE